MHGVGFTPPHPGMGLPFGFAGMADFGDENLPGGGGTAGSAAGGGIPGGSWTNLSASTPSPTALHKMLVELSYGQQQHGLTPRNCPPPAVQNPSFPRFPDPLGNPIPCTANSWVQQLQAATTMPIEGYHSSSSSGHRDPGRHFSQHLALNGGSLVLDTARGELVNASKMTPKEILEAKALAASKSHSEAERRRRERINSHLATLRTLLPSSTKTDKASLLAEVIDQVKMLKRQVSEIYEYAPMPTDHDELSVEKDIASAEGKTLIKASLCCDDRPDLMTDLRQALDTLGLRTLKAEISTLGGRIKNTFSMTLKDGITEQDRDVSVKSIEEALKLVMERSGAGEISPGTSNKRQRIASFETSGCSS